MYYLQKFGPNLFIIFQDKENINDIRYVLTDIERGFPNKILQSFCYDKKYVKMCTKSGLKWTSYGTYLHFFASNVFNTESSDEFYKYIRDYIIIENV